MNEAQAWYVRGGAYRLNRNPQAMDSSEKRLARQFVAQFEKIEPLTEKISVYRGIGFGSYSEQGGAYWSTSTDSEVAKSFCREEIYTDWQRRRRARTVGELLSITVHPGVRVMYIGGVQREVVIDRDVRVEESRRFDAGGYPYIMLNVYPK